MAPLRMLGVYLLSLLVLLGAAAQAARQLAGGGAGRVAGRARLLLLGQAHAVKREVHVHKLPVLGRDNTENQEFYFPFHDES